MNATFNLNEGFDGEIFISLCLKKTIYQELMDTDQLEDIERLYTTLLTITVLNY